MPVEQLTNSLIHDEFLFLDLVDPSAVASCGLQKLQRIYHSATLFCFLSLRDERDFQRRESLVLISALAPSSPDCFIERIIIWIFEDSSQWTHLKLYRSLEIAFSDELLLIQGL